ncbi:MAG: flagellin [Deltaproteobacteria bacterium]|nr:flagellin [Deltaproteobacteria bacterium]
MAMTVNTNIAALNAQRNLGKTQGMLNKSLARLSSGLRINSAKDDAAGLAISTRMSSQIRGLNQAARNANDGISLAQTAEGALQETTNNLQRIRELAIQAGSSSNSAADRASLNEEVTQLVAEIERVASTTSFNGQMILDGTFGTQSFQVGANSGQTISVSMTSARSTALGVGAGSSYLAELDDLQVVTGALTEGGISINGYQVGATVSDGVSSGGATSSAIAKTNAINAISGNTGVTATVNATVTSEFTAGSTAASNTDGLTVNGVTIDDVTATGSAAVNAGEMVAAINEVSAQTGVTAEVTTASSGGYTLTAADGRNIILTGTGASLGCSGLTAGSTFGKIDISSTSLDGILLAGPEIANIGGTAAYTPTTTTVGAGVSSLDISTTGGATSALTIVDAALSTISTMRGSLGATQNRFESTIANLQSVSENLSAANSRIMDADFAAETANMTKAQVMQQAGVAMLAQANMLPQTVLSLLQ